MKIIDIVCRICGNEFRRFVRNIVKVGYRSDICKRCEGKVKSLRGSMYRYRKLGNLVRAREMEDKLRYFLTDVVRDDKIVEE